MDHAINARAARIGAACLLAVLALLLARAPLASAGAPADLPQDAASCGPRESPVAAMDAAVAEAMERTREEQGAAEADPSGWVVLNNRGYNYGPPHQVRIDPDVFQAQDPADAER